MSFSDDQLTKDKFLGGRLHLWQPKTGYRAATDPVLLAAAVDARPGDRVLDLGCGAGAAILCLQRRIADLRGFGLEVQADYANLARRNADENGLDLTVVDGDLAAMPTVLREMVFDHVIANPPFHPATHTGAMDAGRDVAQRDMAGLLSRWIDAGLRRLVRGGDLTVIHRADRLAAVLAALGDRAGDIRILPIAPRIGRAAGRVIVTARKGSKAGATLLTPLVMHEGRVHVTDGDDYSQRARGILREMLPIGLFTQP